MIRLVLASALVIGASAVALQDNSRAAIQREVDAQTRAMAMAFTRGNLREVSRFYADDGVLYHPSGAVVRGRADLDDFWASYEHPVSWKMTTLDVGGSVNEPYQLVHSTLIYDNHEGHRRVGRVTCLFVWRRDASGRLRVHIDMYTPEHN